MNDFNQQIREWKAKRQDMLMRMDLSMARQHIIDSGHTPPEDNETLLASLHKARYEVPSIPDGLRHASRQWLEERGCLRLGGLPWPADGELPTGAEGGAL